MILQSAATFGLALLGTTLFIPLAIRVGPTLRLMSRPRPGRWGARRISLLDGAAMMAGWTLSLALTQGSLGWSPVLTTALALMFALGLVDDRYDLPPSIKLLGQSVPAAAVTAFGIAPSVPGGALVARVWPCLWIVGITNAVNLLDNIDGLAGGTVLLAALAFWKIGGSSSEYASLAAAVAGASGAFLAFNFPKARIFMGNAGSSSLGFLLACIALLSQRGGDGLSGWRWLVPLCVLLLPLLDTTFVAVTRTARGVSVAQGGLDHLSHRLVQRGLSPMSSVLLLLGVAALGGGVAIALHRKLEPVPTMSCVAGNAALASGPPRVSIDRE